MIAPETLSVVIVEAAAEAVLTALPAVVRELTRFTAVQRTRSFIPLQKRVAHPAVEPDL